MTHPLLPVTPARLAQGFPCGRFPMLIEVWAMVIAVSEWTTIYGDHCGHGNDNAHATGRLALKNSTDGGKTSHICRCL